MPNILALDISSTAIGWCYLQDDRAPLAKSIALGGKADIGWLLSEGTHAG